MREERNDNAMLCRQPSERRKVRMQRNASFKTQADLLAHRYANMDFVYASVLRFVAVLLIIVSYDIACQWFINLARRIQDYWPNELKPVENMSMLPLIPKLHHEGHKKTEKHKQYSFNFCKGVGHTDGECPECIWSGHNGVANTTKAMGPGSRHDMLDDHFGFWNFEKYVSMGKCCSFSLLKVFDTFFKEKL